jgi:hypothetical protein
MSGTGVGGRSSSPEAERNQSVSGFRGRDFVPAMEKLSLAGIGSPQVPESFGRGSALRPANTVNSRYEPTCATPDWKQIFTEMPLKKGCFPAPINLVAHYGKSNRKIDFLADICGELEVRELFPRPDEPRSDAARWKDPYERRSAYVAHIESMDAAHHPVSDPSCRRATQTRIEREPDQVTPTR